MDAEDRERTQAACAKVLAYLHEHGAASSRELRACAGHAAMRRVWDLQNGKGPDRKMHPITVRRIKGVHWEVRYDRQPLGRDSRTPQDGQRVLPGLGHGSFAR